MGKVLCIGGSTGAPTMVSELLSRLPADLSAPVLVALHLPEAVSRSFVRCLTGRVPFPVRVAENGVRPEPASVYLGPGGMHIGVSPAGRIVLSPKPAELHFKPSIDVLFYTAARTFGSGVVAVVLTGLTAKKDAVEGARAVRRAGGQVIVLDDPASRFLGMPKAVIDAGAATRVVDAKHLAPVVQEALASG